MAEESKFKVGDLIRHCPKWDNEDLHVELGIIDTRYPSIIPEGEHGIVMKAHNNGDLYVHCQLRNAYCYISWTRTVDWELIK